MRRYRGEPVILMMMKVSALMGEVMSFFLSDLAHTLLVFLFKASTM